MQNCEPLAWYGLLVMVIMAGFIAVPYFRRSSDLATCWNALLLGIAIYTGIGCLEAAYSPGFPFWQFEQIQMTKGDVQWYMAATTVFIASLLTCYYFNSPGCRLAGRALQKWPALTFPVFLFVLVSCGILILAGFFTGSITFIGPTVNNLARKACIVATVFAFVYWYERKSNVALLVVFLAVLALAGIYSMMIFTGRRMLLAVALGPLLAIYWITLRNWPLNKRLISIVVGVAVVFFVGTAYSSFRHFNRGSADKGRSAGDILAQIAKLDSNSVFGLLQRDQLRFFSQSNVKYSLLVRHIIVAGQLPTEPANTLHFLASYPIPRRLWDVKPMTIGRRIGHDIMGLPQTTNFGVGIGGHGAFEGGIPIMVLYAFLVALGIRFLDEPLRNQPTNPFLISILAAAMPHVLAFPRGDFGIMAIETIICFVFVVPLGIVGRILFGTARVAPMTQTYNVRNRVYMSSSR